MNPERALFELFHTLFHADELRRWLRFDTKASVIVRELPGETASAGGLANRAVECLVSYGLVNDDFFVRLKAERPGKAEEIDRVAKLWTTRSLRRRAPVGLARNSPRMILLGTSITVIALGSAIVAFYRLATPNSSQSNDSDASMLTLDTTSSTSSSTTSGGATLSTGTTQSEGVTSGSRIHDTAEQALTGTTTGDGHVVRRPPPRPRRRKTSSARCRDDQLRRLLIQSHVGVHYRLVDKGHSVASGTFRGATTLEQLCIGNYDLYCWRDGEPEPVIGEVTRNMWRVHLEDDAEHPCYPR